MKGDPLFLKLFCLSTVHQCFSGRVQPIDNKDFGWDFGSTFFCLRNSELQKKEALFCFNTQKKSTTSIWMIFFLRSKNSLVNIKLLSSFELYHLGPGGWNKDSFFWSSDFESCRSFSPSTDWSCLALSNKQQGAVVWVKGDAWKIDTKH